MRENFTKHIEVLNLIACDLAAVQLEHTVQRQEVCSAHVVQRAPLHQRQGLYYYYYYYYFDFCYYFFLVVVDKIPVF